jgi:hypothetical protein
MELFSQKVTAPVGITYQYFNAPRRGKQRFDIKSPKRIAYQRLKSTMVFVSGFGPIKLNLYATRKNYLF